MNRGRGYQRIFHQHEDDGAFLETLAEARQRFGLEIHAYCFMPNPYHLLVQTPRGNLARGMRHVNGLYTAYNRGQIFGCEFQRERGRLAGWPARSALSIRARSIM